ncbi:AraC family transcriptional regulator [Bisbaumannia pacifica]|uniref:AraC family transcriptional regulator n=1 Tax=Bisbaumannia pacifica TaxID=77098 RepID=UPI0011BF7BFD|nr:AraC family transcriptional regulator [Halomonas pacifica]
MDKSTQGMGNTDLYAQWDFTGKEFPLPKGAGSGCIMRTSLAHGVTIYYSEYRVIKDCALEIQSSQDDLGNLLCTLVLLSGKLTMEMPAGNTHKQDADHSLIFRVFEEGTRFHLPGNQVIRHLGVSIPLDSPWLIENEIRTLIGPFLKARGRDLITQLPLGKATRQWAADLFLHASETPYPTIALHREGLAKCYLSSLLRDYSASRSQTSTSIGEPSAWELKIYEAACEYIRKSLNKNLNTRIIANKFGISRNRLNELFIKLHGHSTSDYIRHKKLTEAKRLIEHEGVPIKVAAHAVGYHHVSNFTRAYRQYFGGTPSTSRHGNISESPT